MMFLHDMILNINIIDYLTAFFYFFVNEDLDCNMIESMSFMKASPLLQNA